MSGAIPKCPFCNQPMRQGRSTGALNLETGVSTPMSEEFECNDPDCNAICTIRYRDWPRPIPVSERLPETLSAVLAY